MKNILTVVALTCTSACVSVNTITPLPEGTVVKPHRSYVTFCANNPDDCKVPLTANSLRAIQGAHSELRAEFKPRWDAAGIEGDVWSIGNEGDCEDYALTLQKNFRTQYPHYAEAFKLATAYIGNGSQYHAVLTVETLQGTLVCDILKPECADWRSFDYKFDLREDGLAWVKFDEAELSAGVAAD